MPPSPGPGHSSGRGWVRSVGWAWVRSVVPSAGRCPASTVLRHRSGRPGGNVDRRSGVVAGRPLTPALSPPRVAKGPESYSPRPAQRGEGPGVRGGGPDWKDGRPLTPTLSPLRGARG